MGGILFPEFIIVGQRHKWLSWPNGDLTPTDYLAKSRLALSCVFVQRAVFATTKLAGLVALVLLVKVVATIVTGKRSNRP